MSAQDLDFLKDCTPEQQHEYFRFKLYQAKKKFFKIAQEHQPAYQALIDVWQKSLDALRAEIDAEKEAQAEQKE